MMDIKSGKKIIVKDRVIKKKVSTDGLMKNLVATVALELQKTGTKTYDSLTIRNQIEKALNNYAETLEDPNAPSKLEVEIHDRKILLDLNQFGAEKLSQDIDDALRELEFDLEREETFRLILSVNPIIAKCLIPKLNELYPNAALVLRSSEYAASHGAVNLAQQSKFGIESCDLLPYSVGISLYNGIIMKLVEGKSNYPLIGDHVFHTVVDNQKTIRVIAYEGDRLLSRNCKPIGEFVVSNLPPAQAGDIQCQIMLSFDNNGVLTPAAYDIENKKNFAIEVNTSPQLINAIKYGDGLVLSANADTEADRKLYSALDSLDLLIEFLMRISKEIPKQNRQDVLLKIKRAKNYINVHKNDITVEDCEQLRLELDECAEDNNLEKRKSFALPASQVFNETKQKDEETVESKTCVIM